MVDNGFAQAQRQILSLIPGGNLSFKSPYLHIMCKNIDLHQLQVLEGHIHSHIYEGHGMTPHGLYQYKSLDAITMMECVRTG